MGKFYILTQILQGNALFTGKIYTARKFFTRPPVVTVVTNYKSGPRLRPFAPSTLKIPYSPTPVPQNLLCEYEVSCSIFASHALVRPVLVVLAKPKLLPEDEDPSSASSSLAVGVAGDVVPLLVASACTIGRGLKTQN